MTSSSPIIFDRKAVRRHMKRAAAYLPEHDALLTDTSDQLLERLTEINRSFESVLDFSPFPFVQGTGTVISREQVDFDEELMPFTAESFDLTVSNLGLHWTNDVPGTLLQIHHLLKPDGLFLASLFGEHSLHELKSCLLDAELNVTGGVSPRLSPTIDLLTASALMQRAGFKLPVADKETVTVMYPDLVALMHDLRGMGQTNAHVERLKTATRSAVFFEAAGLYHERFGNSDGHIPATFDVIYLHGWK